MITTITRKEFNKLFTSEINQYSTVIGSNGVLNNYLVPFVAAQARLTQTFGTSVEDIISHLRDQLKVRQL